MRDDIYEFFDGKKPIIKVNEKFIDTDFKPNDESIFGKMDPYWDKEKIKKYNEEKAKYKEEKLKVDKNKEISWTRILDSKNEIPFSKENLDIKQGFIGDCYFIAFIHGLRQNYPFIFSSIMGNCQFDKGYFEIYIYFEKNEEILKKKIFVDDYIPYKVLPKEYESLSRPIFSSHYFYSKEIKEEKYKIYMVTPYLLIEKAFAKYKKSYLNIEGSINNSDIYFLLTGVKEKILFLTSDILIEYQKFKEIKERKIKEIEKESKEIKEKKIKKMNGKITKDIEEELKKIEKEKLANVYAEVKKEAIEKNIIDKEKEEIFDKIKKYSETNLINSATEDKKNIGEKTGRTHFGLIANHMYDFLDCKKHKDNIFFYLWNPPWRK